MLFGSNDDQVSATGEPDAADDQAPERWSPFPGVPAAGRSPENARPQEPARIRLYRVTRSG
jgi:hypothetical protein